VRTTAAALDAVYQHVKNALNYTPPRICPTRASRSHTSPSDPNNKTIFLSLERICGPKNDMLSTIFHERYHQVAYRDEMGDICKRYKNKSNGYSALPQGRERTEKELMRLLYLIWWNIHEGMADVAQLDPSRPSGPLPAGGTLLAERERALCQCITSARAYRDRACALIESYEQAYETGSAPAVEGFDIATIKAEKETGVTRLGVLVRKKKALFPEWDETEPE